MCGRSPVTVTRNETQAPLTTLGAQLATRNMLEKLRFAHWHKPRPTRRAIGALHAVCSWRAPFIFSRGLLFREHLSRLRRMN